jgi:hypothetical protein
MVTRFVNLKSELTAEKNCFEAAGFDTYRSRMQCRCAPCQNRRDGVLVISRNNELVMKIIRCKSCVKGGSDD